MLCYHLAGTDGHAVVLAEDIVNLLQVPFIFLQCLDGALLRPVALQRGGKPDAGILFQRIEEPVVAVYGGRGAFQSHHLYHRALAVQLCGDVTPHLTPHIIVVGTDVGGVFLGGGLAVKDDDGDAHIVGTVYGGRDGGHLVGRHDEQVNALAYELVNLFYLLCVVIIG